MTCRIRSLIQTPSEESLLASLNFRFNTLRTVVHSQSDSLHLCFLSILTCNNQSLAFVPQLRSIAYALTPLKNQGLGASWSSILWACQWTRSENFLPGAASGRRAAPRTRWHMLSYTLLTQSTCPCRTAFMPSSELTHGVHNLLLHKGMDDTHKAPPSLQKKVINTDTLIDK